jgi:glutamyl-tRNA reductase
MTAGFIEIGINHLDAPVSSRERLAASAACVQDSLRSLRAEAELEQVVLLSTCSRFEVFAYCARPEKARADVAAWLARRGGEEIRPYLRERSGPAAVEHLFRVAAGLESWILGESEILGQFKKAYQTASAAGFTGAELNRLFQSAVAAGKAARARTGIADGIHSIGGAAALLARRIFGEEKRGTVCIFGAGEAAETVGRHLAAKNFRDILVANRTRERAEELARAIGGSAVSFEEGLGLLGEIDVAVLSVSSPEPIIKEAALRGRGVPRGRSLFLIDLGLPRNAAPGCAALPGVFVYDLDDLKNVVAQSMERKSGAVREAEVVVREAAADCLLQFEKARARRGAAVSAA